MDNILYITPDWVKNPQDFLEFNLVPPHSGAGEYRCRLPGLALAAAGWRVEITPNFAQHSDGSIVGVQWAKGEDWTVGEKVWDSDVVVTQRFMGENSSDTIQKARAAGQTVLADIDDHYWALPPYNPACQGTDPGINPTFNREHYKKGLSVCDGLICSTPELVSHLEPLGVPIYLQRNMIDLQRWPYRPPIKIRKPRVGWTGDVGYRSTDLMEGTGGAVGEFCNEHELQFTHIGARDGYPTAASFLRVKAELAELQFPQSDINMFSRFMQVAGIHIGIIPMKNNSFNRAKSCLKGMEYAACGIPFVASRLPEYEWFGQGILAKNKKQWREGLERLLDYEERQSLSEAAYERVKGLDWRVVGGRYVEMMDDFLA